MGQCDPLKLFGNVPQLHCIGFQKIASGGYIEKKLFHRKRTARVAGADFLFFDRPPFNAQAYTMRFRLPSCWELNMGDGRNGRECFSAKSFGLNLKQIVGLANF